jgi:hypothetical protein
MGFNMIIDFCPINKFVKIHVTNSR